MVTFAVVHASVLVDVKTTVTLIVFPGAVIMEVLVRVFVISSVMVFVTSKVTVFVISSVMVLVMLSVVPGAVKVEVSVEVEVSVSVAQTLDIELLLVLDVELVVLFVDGVLLGLDVELLEVVVVVTGGAGAQPATESITLVSKVTAPFWA